MVCPSENSEDDATPRVGSELERRSSLNNHELRLSEPVAAERRSEPVPAEPTPALTRRPTMRRSMSRALVLTAADAGEHAPGKRSDGRRSEWWENALSRPSMALHRMSHMPGGQERPQAAVRGSRDQRNRPDKLDE